MNAVGHLWPLRFLLLFTLATESVCLFAPHGVDYPLFYAFRGVPPLIAFLFLWRFGALHPKHLGLDFHVSKIDVLFILYLIISFLGITLILAGGAIWALRREWFTLESITGDFHNLSTMKKYLLEGLLLAPIVEEFIYRGILTSILRTFAGETYAILMSGLLFYAVHLAYGREEWMIHYFFAGTVLAWAFLKTGKLWVPIVLHLFGNILMGLDDALLLFAPDGVQRLIGG